MRHDRTLMRAIKLAVLLGVAGLVAEGLFELKLLTAPFLHPPSVPGQSKIIEHFMIQHLAFPVIGLLLVFAPLRLMRFFSSKLAAGLLAAIAMLVTLPEFIVSRTDLFRPYPFELHIPALKTIQMLQLGRLQLNMLQVQHALFAHVGLMGAIVAIAIFGPQLLVRFAGPRTGEKELFKAP